METEQLRTEEETPFRGIAKKIVQLNLTAPAILFIGNAKPLGFVAGQFLRFVSPSLSLFVKADTLESAAEALEDRGGVEAFLREIERFSNESDEPDKTRGDSGF